MDNVMFAVADRNTQHLLAKFMLGDMREEAMSRKQLPGNGEYLAFLQRSNGAFWHIQTGLIRPDDYPTT